MRQSQDNTPSPVHHGPRRGPDRSFVVGDFSFPLMALTPQDIDRIAHLAQLELTPLESRRMLSQLSGFFAIVDRMRAVDTAGLTPLAHPVAAVEDIALRLRDDVVSEPDQRAANQKSAPAVERGLFLVPKVIE